MSSYEDLLNELMAHGISLDCYSPLEISYGEEERSVATGALAQLVIEYLRTPGASVQGYDDDLASDEDD